MRLRCIHVQLLPTLLGAFIWTQQRTEQSLSGHDCPTRRPALSHCHLATSNANVNKQRLALAHKRVGWLSKKPAHHANAKGWVASVGSGRTHAPQAHGVGDLLTVRTPASLIADCVASGTGLVSPRQRLAMALWCKVASKVAEGPGPEPEPEARKLTLFFHLTYCVSAEKDSRQARSMCVLRCPNMHMCFKIKKRPRQYGYPRGLALRPRDPRPSLPMHVRRGLIVWQRC